MPERHNTNLEDEENARTYLGGRGVVDDSINAFAALQMDLDIPERIKPVPTYSQYVNAKAAANGVPQVGPIVVRMSDKKLVRAFDSVVRKINAIVRKGITTEVQTQTIGKLLEEANRIVRS